MKRGKPQGSRGVGVRNEEGARRSREARHRGRSVELEAGDRPLTAEELQGLRWRVRRLALLKYEQHTIASAEVFQHVVLSALLAVPCFLSI